MLKKHRKKQFPAFFIILGNSCAIVTALGASVLQAKRICAYFQEFVKLSFNFTLFWSASISKAEVSKLCRKEENLL